MKHFYSFVNDSQCTTNVGNSLFDYVNFATTVSEMNNISKRHVLIKKTIRAFSAAPRFWIKVTPRIRLPCYVGHYLRVPTSRFTSTQAYTCCRLRRRRRYCCCCIVVISSTSVRRATKDAPPPAAM